MNKWSFVFLLIALFFVEGATLGQSGGDSLQMKMISAKDDTIRIELLNQEAFSLRGNNPDKAMAYADHASQISLRNANIKGLLNALKIKGMICKYKGDYEKSMDYSLKALKLAEIRHDETQMSNCYNIIGSIYQAKSNYERAIFYFNKSFEIEMKLGNKEEASIRLYNLGTVYDMSNKKETALKLYDQSLKLEEQLNREEGIMYARYAIGGIMTDRGDYANAEPHLAKALSFAEKNKNISMVSYCSFELGRLYAKTNRLPMAVSSLRKCYLIADSINDKSQLKEVCLELSTLYSKVGDFRQAFEYQSKYLKINESLNNSASNNKIAKLIREHEIDQRNREYELLLKKNQIEKLELIQNKNFRNYFILMSLVILVVLGVNYSKRHKGINANPSTERGIWLAEKIVLPKLKLDIDRLRESKYLWVAFLMIYFLLYLLLFQPFGLISLTWIESVFVIPIYLSLLMMVCLLVIMLEAKVQVFIVQRGQIFRLLLLSLFICLAYALLVWVYRGIQLEGSWNLSFFSEVFLNVLIPAIFPIILSFLLRGQMIFAQYIEKFESVAVEAPTAKTVFDADFMLRIETDNIREIIVVQKSKLICIEANDNYSAVYFEKNGKIQKNLYRITLKKIETSLIGYEEFVRCHKSYIVNVNHLQKVVGNSQKYKIKLDLLDFDVPISRNFPNEMLQSLRERADVR